MNTEKSNTHLIRSGMLGLLIGLSVILLLYANGNSNGLTPLFKSPEDKSVTNYSKIRPDGILETGISVKVDNKTGYWYLLLFFQWPLLLFLWVASLFPRGFMGPEGVFALLFLLVALLGIISNACYLFLLGVLFRINKRLFFITLLLASFVIVVLFFKSVF